MYLTFVILNRFVKIEVFLVIQFFLHFSDFEQI